MERFISSCILRDQANPNHEGARRRTTQCGDDNFLWLALEKRVVKASSGPVPTVDRESGGEITRKMH